MYAVHIAKDEQDKLKGPERVQVALFWSNE